jgi:ribokinase
VPDASDVVVVGSINVDLTRRVPHHPAPGETVLAEHGSRGLGGKGANQAVAAAAAGAAVGFVGCVGDDPEGGFALDRLAASGVDTARVRVVEGAPTGTALVVVAADGENTIVVDLAANAALTAADVDAALDGQPVVLLQGEVPPQVVVHAVERAASTGSRCVLNLAPAIDVPGLPWLLLDLLVVNEPEAAALAARVGLVLDDEPERAAAALAERLGTSVVLTLGARGAAYAERSGSSGLVPPPPVDRVVDTTGAGDAFVGALAAALVRRTPLAEAVEHGNAAGAAAVARGRQDATA